MASGGLTALFLNLFLELTGPRRWRIETELDIEALQRIDGFLREFAAARGWPEEASDRLRSAGEEAFLSLVDQHRQARENERQGKRRLLTMVHGDRRSAELEFVAASGDENLEDVMVLLSEQPGTPVEHEISLRLLRHYASSVRHQQYHGTDIVTVNVQGAQESS